MKTLETKASGASSAGCGCELAKGVTLKARALNLATEGIFIKTPGPLEVGEKLTVEFLIPGTLNSLRLSGAAVWTRRYPATQGTE